MQASCHCGAVSLTVTRPPERVTECNCSICRRLGALWAYYTGAEVTLPNLDATSTYVWGDRCIAFHHCPRCGCTTHYTGIGADADDRVAINARLLPLEADAPVPVRRFDGASSWKVVSDSGVYPWPTG